MKNGEAMLPHVYGLFTDIMVIAQHGLDLKWKKFYIKSLFKNGFGKATKKLKHRMGLKINLHGKAHLKTKGKIHVKAPKVKIGVHAKGKVAAKGKVHAKIGIHGKAKAHAKIPSVKIGVHGNAGAKAKAHG